MKVFTVLFLFNITQVFSQLYSWDWVKGNVFCPSQLMMMYGDQAVDHQYPNQVSPTNLEVDSSGNVYVFGNVGFNQHAIFDYINNSFNFYVPQESAHRGHYYVSKFDSSGNELWTTFLEGDVFRFGENLGIDLEKVNKYHFKINPFNNKLFLSFKNDGSYFEDTIFVNGNPHQTPLGEKVIILNENGDLEHIFSISGYCGGFFFQNADETIIMNDGGLNLIHYSNSLNQITSTTSFGANQLVYNVHPITRDLLIMPTNINGNPVYLFNKTGDRLYECYKSFQVKCYDYPSMDLLWSTYTPGSYVNTNAKYDVDFEGNLWVQMFTLNYSYIDFIVDADTFSVEPDYGFGTVFSFPLNPLNGKPGIVLKPTRMLNNSYGVNGFKVFNKSQFWAGNVYLEAQFGETNLTYLCPNWAVPLQHFVSKVSYEDSDIFSYTANIDEIILSEFELFPNPSSNFFQISNYTNSPIIEVKIYSSLGNLVEKYENSVHYSTENLQNDLYFVEIKTRTNSTIKKLIVNK